MITFRYMSIINVFAPRTHPNQTIRTPFYTHLHNDVTFLSLSYLFLSRPVQQDTFTEAHFLYFSYMITTASQSFIDSGKDPL